MCGIIGRTMNFKLQIVAVICVVVLKSVYGDIEQKNSLTFIIDKTRSMKTAINGVLKGVNDIFEVIAHSSESSIYNYLLVTFGDPIIDAAKMTTDQDKFRSFIKKISQSLESGGDCPEMSIGGIKEGLVKSKPGSYIYVFTDSSPKDIKLVKEVKKIATEKGSQVVFFLTPSNRSVCYVPRDSAEVAPYIDLSQATSGQVFYLDKSSVKKILNYISIFVKSQQIILRAENYPAGQHNVTYLVDTRTKNVTVAIAGKDIKIINIKEFNIKKLKKIVHMADIWIYMFDNDVVGNCTITFSSSKSSSMVVSASSDVRFQHGFTTNLPLTFEDSHVKPIADIPNSLIIKLRGNNVELTSAMYQSLTYKTLTVIPLQLLDEEKQLYATNFVGPPKGPFRIAVYGTDKITNTPIARFGSMIIESEKLLPPNVTISGKKKLHYNESLELMCNVTAYPKPNIEWIDKDNGKHLEASMSSEDPPYGFSSILKLENMKNNAKYQCKAYNKVKSGTADVEVEVKSSGQYFEIIEEPKSVEIVYGNNTDLHCKVNASQPVKVKWYTAGHNRFEISENGDTLSIKYARRSGTYFCEVHNFIDNKIISLNATVSVIYVAPKINKVLNEEVHVREGTTAVLTCSILEGIPNPRIYWYRKIAKSRRVELKSKRNKSTITIEFSNQFDTATYLCVAFNGIISRKDSYYIKLFVESPPSIEDENNKNDIVIKENDYLNMTCNVKGVPTPNVAWFKDNATLRNGIEVYRDHSFKVKAELSDGGVYTCNATNTLGFMTKTVNVTVTNLRITSEPRTYSPMCGTTLTLECKAEGSPTPKLKWKFYSFYETEPILLSNTEPFLILSDIQLDHKGNYSCVASNIGGTMNITHEVNVSCVRAFTEQHSLTCSNSLTLKCKDERSLKRKIEWTFLSFYTEELKKLQNTEPFLVLDHIKLEERGNYTCVANYTGNLYVMNHEVNVLCKPFVLPHKNEYLAEDGDSQLRLYCNATGNPKPEITWTTHDGYRIVRDDTKYYMEEGLLLIKNVSSKDPVSYSCEAINIIKRRRSSQSSKFHIQFKPCSDATIIQEKAVPKGASLNISCSIPHKPIDHPVWFKDKQRLLGEDGDFLSINGTNEFNSSIYTCKVNHLGDKAEYTSTRVSVLERSGPQFLNDDVKMDLGYMYGKKFDLDCRATGVPHPTVTWYYNKIKESDSKMVKPVTKTADTIEEYKCEVSNDVFHISRSFKITLKGCILKEEANSYQPLITSTSGSLPTYKFINGFTVIPQNDIISLSCPDGFNNFNEKNVNARCEEGEYLNIDRHIYNYADIKCRNEFKLNEEHKGSCLGADTEMISQVFNFVGSSKPIIAYETCVSKTLRQTNNEMSYVPFYSKLTMISPADTIPYDTTITNADFTDIYSENCQLQNRIFREINNESVLANSRCCFTRRQLVSPKDVYPSLFQRATFKMLNTIPHWSSCSTENWDEVEDRVRRLAKTSKHEPVVFTGIARWLSLSDKSKRTRRLYLSDDEKLPVPMYLWKVIQYPLNSSLAVVQVNSPDLELTDGVLCDDICDKVPWMRSSYWRDIKRGYIFCCDLRSFEDAFNLRVFIENSYMRMDFVKI